eukprot:Gregarina_sp_Poly_1__6648@NODE_3578_length_995_cov_54_228448_g2273_i0_p1_GENE_NODE_3578_length_995_cov_54_228448_g2273_i0NODE_3578_length_995_cov_54_228448_g2273_i0_p1_ORF_typecomplete_len113_score8_74_NODE_3578_length_995_cov_54_228448_g2273_i0635973
MNRGSKWRASSSDLEEPKFVFFRHSLTALLSAPLFVSSPAPANCQLVFPDGNVGLAASVNLSVIAAQGSTSVSENEMSEGDASNLPTDHEIVQLANTDGTRLLMTPGNNYQI